TAPTYHPFSPVGPAICAVVCGAVVSTPNDLETTGPLDPAPSTAYASTVCSPSPTSNDAEYVAQGPPSRRYSIESTPLPASVAAMSTVTIEWNQSPSPAVPSREMAVCGAVVSIRNDLETTGPLDPAPSTAYASTVCSPSPTSNDAEYVSQRPPSRRYSIESRPLPASVAAMSTVTIEWNQSPSPAVPSREIAVCGAVVSIRNDLETTGPLDPAPSTAYASTVCSPSPTS